MKNIRYIYSLIGAALLFFVACNKVDDLPYYDEGSAVTLSASTTTVTPTLADSTRPVISFSWTNPDYSADSSTFKYILQIDSAGRNFSKAVSKEVIGVTTTSLTGRELNGYLLDYGFTVGTPYTLDVRVISSYGNNNERYTSNTVKITVTPFNDPSILTATTNTVTGTLATAASNALTFNWTRSFVGYTGSITYTLQYDSSGKNFTSLQEMAIGANLLTRAMTQEEINTTALNEGVTGGTTGKIEYRIKAVTALGATSFSNAVSITVNTYMPLLRLYMPGNYQTATGNGTDWTPANAPELIRDLRPEALNKLYYAYLYLPAGTMFKITPNRDWSVAYGSAAGNSLSTSGGDISVPAAGWYRISVDMANLKYDIREGRMGFVGGATPAGWTPSAIFPSQAMSLIRTNVFLGIQDFVPGGWKLLDNNDWNNGDITAVNAKSYGSSGPSGSTLTVNGPNMPDITTAGRYRVIWNGTEPDNLKYEMNSAAEMRVVGNGIQGFPEWNPGASPQMNYIGNGKWTITLNLISGKDFKFLAGNDWGAFDYEDASGGSTATATPRKIKWEGGGDFKTPVLSGTYTIVLDEYAQTVTIN